MGAEAHTGLTRRERQIMDAIYRREAATVTDVLADLPDPPSYSAVRAMLRKLEEKGHVEHAQDGPRYVYRPTLPSEEASRRALDGLVRTFFGGSASRAFVALLDRSVAGLSEAELKRLAGLIEDARKGES